MTWDQLFSPETWKILALPAGIGIAVMTVLYFLRRYLYKHIHRATAKTNTQFDDIMVRETRIMTLLWCIWLGISAGYKTAVTPQSWVSLENRIISVLFVSLAIYTVISVLLGIFKWYKAAVCPRTNSNLDDIILSVLIFGTPVVAGALGIIVILNMLGISSAVVNDWLAAHGPRLALLIVVAVILVLMTMLLVPKFVDRVVRNARSEQTEDEMNKRSDTLVSVIDTTFQVVIIFIFTLMILTELGINITAVLTGAGVAGIAIGFGAQSLVKDVLSGLFIILENQYRKGDVVDIAGKSGVVEEINLRRTVLRDMDGIYHVIPNGQISISSNMTRQYARINLNISVAYDTDLDKAIAVINRVCREMYEDPAWTTAFTGQPQVLRVDKLGDSGIDIKITGEVKPGRQWMVNGELRLRIKKVFDNEGIEIPYPHTKVYFGDLPPHLSSQEVKSREQNGNPKQ